MRGAFGSQRRHWGRSFEHSFGLGVGGGGGGEGEFERANLESSNARKVSRGGGC